MGQQRHRRHPGQRPLKSAAIAPTDDQHGRIDDDGGQVKELPDVKIGEFSKFLNFCGFGEGQSILYIDSKVADGAFDLRVAKQDLYGAQIARLLINNRRLGPAQ